MIPATLIRICSPASCLNFRRDIRCRLPSILSARPHWAPRPEPELRKLYHAKDSFSLAAKAGIAFDPSACDLTPATINTKQADAQLAELGHYQGAMLYYGGEWYWGLDRLHYLEARLKALGLAQQNKSAHFVEDYSEDYSEDYIFAPPEILSEKPTAQVPKGTKIDFYLSFRSPYTAIAAPRKALADAYGADLNLRFVLPMVMRGLPVPPSKNGIFCPMLHAKPIGRGKHLAALLTRLAGL